MAECGKYFKREENRGRGAWGVCTLNNTKMILKKKKKKKKNYEEG